MTPSLIPRAMVALCLMAVVAGCCQPRLPCISGQMRPHPIFVDPEGFCALEAEIDCLNHRFAPYEAAMDRCPFPKRVCRRLVKVDNDLQHVSAALISREIAPEKVQRDVDRIEADLAWIASQTSMTAPPNKCCKSRRAMGGSLNAQLAAQRSVAPSGPQKAARVSRGE
ncbi:MAG: hypothetical protein WCI40_07805 [Verrucomicrobiota bacterium]